MLHEDLEDVGGFDEGFTGYGWEDLEMALRMCVRGVVFEYEPRAVGYHYHVETLPGSARNCARRARAPSISGGSMGGPIGWACFWRSTL